MRCRGFTLIETLIAVAVLSVGLLGAAAMLLASLHGQVEAWREIAATNLLRDVAERIRINPEGRAAYAARGFASESCGVQACSAAQLAAADRAYFARAALAQVANDTTTAIEFVPAIGPTAPDRYVLTLRFADASDYGLRVISLQVLLRAPVAG